MFKCLKCIKLQLSSLQKSKSEDVKGKHFSTSRSCSSCSLKGASSVDAKCWALASVTEREREGARACARAQWRDFYSIYKENTMRR